MQVKDITTLIEEFAPLLYQEDYDNAGLIIGKPTALLQGVLLCIDITEDILNEALEHNCNLIISHHPIVFSGLKKFTGKNMVERIVEKAIKNDINIYACHTNIDAVAGGVSFKGAEKLGLKNTRILKTMSNQLLKLVCFVPEKSIDVVRKAVFEAGAGHIGNYSHCSYNIKGKGSFKGDENANPYVGEKNELHFEDEIRFETIVPKVKLRNVVKEMIKAHPYEEVAYDVYTVENSYEKAGFGVIGELEQDMEPKDFLDFVKRQFKCKTIRHTELVKTKIKKVAFCGGAGSFLLGAAKSQAADIFISGDFKYHQFFEAEKDIIIADIGHYESEQYTLELFYDILKEKMSKFAVRLTGVNTNPINYY